MNIIMKQYQPKYEHDAYKLDALELIKKPTEKHIEESKIIQKYNGYYKRFISGDKTSAVVKELDKLQDIINGETNS